jgi:PAS domain S-box-containing protein
VEPQSKARSTINPDARYQLLVEAVTDYAIYMLDPDGFVVSWNPGAQRLKGYTEAEILGRHFSLFYPEEDVRAGMPARTLATASHEGRFEAEGWRVAQDGRRFWAHVVVDPIRAPDGELIGFAKVTRDLSERRVAEESLRRSEEQFRLLVQGVTDYAIYMLDRDGIITNWNVGAERIKGYAAAEVVGSHFSRFYRPEDRAAGLPGIALATAAREGRFESEGWRLRKDGSAFWANVVIDPIRDAEGAIIGFAKVTRDVTEKRDAQQALEKAREALFQSQKLDAIGQLTGGIAHDFNNVLMIVLSSLELLRRRVSDDEAARRLIDNAEKGAKRGVSLTQRMLAFARRQELKPAAVDIAATVQGMRDMLERMLGSTVRVETAIPDGLALVRVDPNQLELAILNLAVNARDAMASGGRLVLSGREESVAAGSPSKLAPGSYVCLSIEDSGTGMDVDTLERAIEPFYTTKGVGKGTGLGLPMVHGLAAQSGGQFVLKSSPGLGTTAELWLPATTADDVEATPAVPSTSPLQDGSGAARRQLIVAVDDDNLVLMGTVAMLEELGHSVLPAASVDEALAALAREPGVALVITDHVMPERTGAELIEQLRTERPDLPVILASGYAELPATSVTIARKLIKPFDQRQLAKAVEDALSQAKKPGQP